MSYTIQNKDIVIAGFQGGINDSIFSGAADMRNIELMTVPGEASVALGTTKVAQPPVLNAVAFTAVTGTSLFTISNATGLYSSAAIVLNTNSSTGPSTALTT